MNWIDLMILSVAGFAAYRGYRTGVLRQVVSLCAFFLATFFCTRLSYLIEPLILSYFEVPERALRAVSLSLSFILIVVVVRWVGYKVERLVSFSLIRLGNRLLGALIAPFFVLLCVSFLFLTVDTIFPPPEESELSIDIRNKSRFYQPVKAIVPRIFYSSNRSIPSLEEKAVLDSLEEVITKKQVIESLLPSEKE